MRVVTGKRYIFRPNLLDQIHVCATGLKAGDVVTVVRLRGAPGPNTMGQCHVNGTDGRFAGMVSCNSLEPVRAPIARPTAHDCMPGHNDWNRRA